MNVAARALELASKIDKFMREEVLTTTTGDLLEVSAFLRHYAEMLVSEPVVSVWHDGVPNHVYASEEFIAELDDGSRVVLKALPEENPYDFTTRDGIYLKARKVKRWAQFSDSVFFPATSGDSINQQGQPDA